MFIAAIECFDKAGAVVVSRTRFAPVKTTSDLFVLRSDAYKIAEDATIAAVVAPVSWLLHVTFENDRVGVKMRYV
jgi:hypothetical protein